MIGKDEHFQEAMNQGHSAAWDQNWEQAAAFYRQALDEIPDDPKALSSLALAMFEMREFRDSLKNYIRVAQLLPKDPVPLEKASTLYERLGNQKYAAEAALRAADLYLEEKDVDKAVKSWSRVIGLDPENLRAHSRLALIYEKTRRVQLAAREYLFIASLVQHTGDLEKAIQAVNRALLIYPSSTEAREALVMLRENKPLPKPSRPRAVTAPLDPIRVRHLEAPQIEISEEESYHPVEEAGRIALTVLAESIFEQTNEEMGSGPVVQRGLQSVMISSSRSPKGKRMDHSRAMLYLSQAVDLQMRGDFVRAAEELERGIEAGLETDDAYFNLGMLYYRSEREDEAIKSFRRVITHKDYALASRLLMGEMQRNLGNLKDAAIEYLRALELADSYIVSPDDAEGLRQLYEPLIDMQSNQSDPENHSQLCENVSQLLLRSEWRKHLSRVRKELAPYPVGGTMTPLAEILMNVRSSRVVEALATVQQVARKGFMRSALEEAFYALQEAPIYIPLHITIGELLLKDGRVQHAVEKFIIVARFYSVRGETERALEMYRRVVEMAPMELEARSELIRHLIIKNEIEEAINEHLNLAEVYYNLADIEESRKTYNKALLLAQQSNVDKAWKVRALHRIADIDVQSLDWRQAVNIFAQIRKLRPDDEKARQSLIELNIRLGRNREALKELKDFIRYMESNGKQLDLVEFLENLVDELPDQAVIRHHLADLYIKIGKKSKAINQLDVVKDQLIRAGDRKGARDVLELILKLNPPNATFFQRLLNEI